MRVKHIFTSLVSCLLLLTSVVTTTAFAEVALPDGAVKGLPERLAALDSEGNAVNSATGEYFFRVEDMDYGVTYTKDIQLMNLREDYAYHIYFSVEPLYKAGDIDLEKGCECVFLLDGEEFFRGDVNGHGNIDLTQEAADCGDYYPGDSHILRAEITWNDIDVIQNVDNGHRLVDKDGEHVLVGPGESGHAEGEIEFKWIFYAQVLDVSTVDGGTDIQTTTVDQGQGTDTQTATTNDGGGTETSPPTPTDVHDNTDISTDPGHTTDTSETTGTVTTTTTKPGNTPGGFFPPFTGYLARDGKPWLIAMGVIGAMIAVMLILIHKDKNKRDKK